MSAKFLVAAFAATALLFSGPAMARVKSADLGAARMSFNAANGRYCLTAKAADTGTRLPRVECRTAEQWKAEGLSVAVK